jgi:hypothetical protein
MELDSGEHCGARAHGKCMASQELRTGPGVFPTEVGTICPTYADAQVLLETRVLERARVASTLVASSDLSSPVGQGALVVLRAAFRRAGEPVRVVLECPSH